MIDGHYGRWMTLKSDEDCYWLRQPETSSSWKFEEGTLHAQPSGRMERILLRSNGMSDFHFTAEIRVKGEAQLLLMTQPGYDSEACYRCLLKESAEIPTGHLAGRPFSGIAPRRSERYRMSVSSFRQEFEIQINDSVVTRGHVSDRPRLIAGYLGFEVLPGNECEVRDMKLRVSNDSQFWLPTQDSRKNSVENCSVLIDADRTQFDEWISGLAKQSQRPVALGVRDSASGPRFQAVSMAATDQRQWLLASGLSQEEDIARFRTLGAIGNWALLARLPCKDGKSMRYVSLYQGANATGWQGWRFSTWERFLAKLDLYRMEKAYRPIAVHCLSATSQTGQTGPIDPNDAVRPAVSEVSLVAHRSKENWDYFAPLTGEACQQRAEEALTGSRYVEHVHVVPTDRGLRFGLIVVDNPLEVDSAFDFGLSKTQYLEAIDAYRQRGMCPHAIASFEVDDEVRYAISWRPSRYLPDAGSRSQSPD